MEAKHTKSKKKVVGGRGRKGFLMRTGKNVEPEKLANKRETSFIGRPAEHLGGWTAD